MQHSTIDQPGMEEILCKKGKELGKNNLQRMFSPGQEDTEVPCHLENKISLDNQKLDNQHDPKL